MTRRRIVVVGAGVAGLSCALACAVAGASVVVLDEQAMAPALPAHIEVGPGLLRDLNRLCIAHECVRRGFVYNGLSVVDEDGAEALLLPTPRLAGDLLPPAVGIGYGDFIDTLEGAAKRAGVDIRRGTRVRQVEPLTGQVVTDRGERVQGDLVVVAAGVGSPLVSSVFGAPATGIHHEAWWHTTMARPEGLDRPVWMAGQSGRRLLVVPISMTRAGLAVVRTSEVRAVGSGVDLAATLRAWGSFPRRIAASIDPQGPTVLRDVSAALLDPPWHRDTVLLAGASAHAIAPPFGQPAALSIEDAVVLGELVRSGLHRVELLQRFMERRSPRVARIHALTSRAARWLSSPDPAADLAALGEQIQYLVAEPA